jgi:hypothetical protein
MIEKIPDVLYYVIAPWVNNYLILSFNLIYNASDGIKYKGVLQKLREKTLKIQITKISSS